MKGIAPDIVLPSVLDALEIGEEFLPHALPWTVVDPALYRPVANLRPLIPELRRKSEARCAGESRFKHLGKLVDDMRGRQASKEITLNLEERLALAKTEKGLDEAEEDAIEAMGSENAAQGQDVVLSEALRILVDLATAQEQGAPQGEGSVPAPVTVQEAGPP